MGNRVSFTPTKFTDVRSEIETLGFRAFDDYGRTYNNTWDSIPDDDMEFLREVVTSPEDENLAAMLGILRENEDGCYIGDTWYDHGEIRSILELVEM